jgi:hypothetical protein
MLVAALPLLMTGNSVGQIPEKEFHEHSLNETEFRLLKEKLSVNKIIPAEYEKPILIALSYFPELLNTAITFRVKKTRTPLSSRPAWTALLQSKRNRKYIITISDSTIAHLSPILFKQLDFNSQVGVIGHELSHIADFASKGFWGLTRIGFGNLSQRYLDRFEYRTDSICIAHGLGYQLLSWSIFVRKALMHENWTGADNIHSMMQRERYMNPETIRKRISANPLYKVAE